MSAPLRILSSWRFSDPQLDAIRRALPTALVAQETARTPADVEAALVAHPGTEMLYTGIAPRGQQPSGLRLVQFHSAGTGSVRDSDAWSWPADLAHGSGVTATAVAELAVAGLLAVRRRLPRLVEIQASGAWPQDRLALAGDEISGTTALVVGYGNIGRAVARILDGFGVRVEVAASDPDRRSYSGFMPGDRGDVEGLVPRAWHGLALLDHALGAADHVLLCLDAGEETLLDERRLALLRASGVVVNVGRGGLVDSLALDAALRAGRLGGAVLDTVDPEPLPDGHPLWTAPGALITSHMGGTTRQAGEHAVRLLVENATRVMNRMPPLNLIRR